MSRKINPTGTDYKMLECINRFLYERRGQCYSYKELVSEYLRQDYGREPTGKETDKISDKGDYKGLLQSARKAISQLKKSLEKLNRSECFLNIKKKGEKVRFGYTNSLDFNVLDSNSTRYHQMRRQALEQLLRRSNGIISEDILCKTAVGKKEREIIHFETSDQLTNVGLVSDFYFDILEQKAVKFHYTSFKSFSGDIILSPHYLKEYDCRWYVIGYTEEKTDRPSIFAIDRIDSDVVETDNVKWREPKEEFDYKAWFTDIIGVTHQYKNQDTAEMYPKTEIIFETLNAETHGMIKTLRIHNSQSILRDYDPSTNTPGLVRLYLRTNQQLIEELFKYSIDYRGLGIKVIEPKTFGDKLAEKARKIVEMYSKCKK